MKLTFDKDSHTYQLDGKPIPSVTSTLKDVGLVNFDNVPEVLLENARIRGNAVHLATELYDRDDLDGEVDEEIKPYLDAWIKFLEDTKFDIRQTEMPLYSKEYWFAGTVDRVGFIQGKGVLLDIKTSSRLAKTTALQTMAYKMMYEEFTGLPIEKRMAVQLKKDGTYRVKEYKDDDGDTGVFLSCLNVIKWKNRRAK